MTHEEIIALAKEAGLPYLPTPNSALVRIVTKAVLIEREACAKVCESTVWTASIPEWREMTKHDVSSKSMHECAAAIRARGAA